MVLEYFIFIKKGSYALFSSHKRPTDKFVVIMLASERDRFYPKGLTSSSRG